MQIDLRGRGVLLTGGSRGIGEATVRALSEAGARVVFTYRTERERAEQLARELGPAVMPLQCDLADSDALPALVANAADELGRIDVLVNNAGIFAENPFDGNDYAAWRAGWQSTFAVNVFGAADLTWLVLRAWRSEPAGDAAVRGRIVNITSRAAHRGELTFADYGASKAALSNFTKSLARSCARDGIVAFTIAPGFIETEMAAPSLAAGGDAIRAEIPSQRIGTPAEVASIVTFFASGLGDYATGTTIDVNGASYVR